MEQILQKRKGLVIRQANYGEYDRILTVLTADAGVISIAAKGVRSIKNKNAAACQLLSYNEFVVQKKSAEMYSLRQAEMIEPFAGLRYDVEALASAVYFADLAGYVSCGEDEALLKLLLNTLHFLATEPGGAMRLRAMYELRLLALAGFCPQLAGCALCGAEKVSHFSAAAGGGICASCRKETGGNPLSAAARMTMTYLVESPLKQAFSFTCAESVLAEILRLNEQQISLYISPHIKTLTYLKKLMK